MSQSTKYFFAVFALIFALHFLWELQNDTPPVWDMAYHEAKGWDYYRAWKDGRFWSEFAQISTHYPPLYYLQEAVVLSVVPDPQFVALATNLFSLLLLSYSTFGIASLWMSRSAALWTGLTILLLPFVAWLSRTTLLDVPLAAWTAAAAYALLRSEYFQHKGWTIIFGLCSAAGALTKWTFPVCVLPLLLYTLVYTKDRKKALVNLCDASLLAIPIAFLWYLPNLQGLLNRYPTTEQTSLIPWSAYPRHGEPGLSSVLGWVYYPRALSSYFLYLPLTVLFFWGTVRSIRRREAGSVAALWWWLLGGMFLLIFVTPKDPRFVIPLVPPLIILLMHPWRDRRYWVPAIYLFAFVQFLTVSFSTPLHPLKIALFETDDSNYQSIQQEWVFYQTHYFGLTGPPARENWRLTEILNTLEDDTAIGFVPDVARFHPGALTLCALRRGRSLEVVRLGESSQSLDVLSSLDYVVCKTGAQGLSFVTAFNDQIYRTMEKDGWPAIAVWSLPDGSQAFLRRRPEVSLKGVN